MPIVWPQSLPNPAGGTFTETSLETKVQDQSEVGAPRRRNRFTRALARFEFEMILEEDDKATLLEFYDETLVRGVEAFEWTHPTTGRTYLMTMPSRPVATHRDGDIWTLNVELDEI